MTARTNFSDAVLVYAASYEITKIPAKLQGSFCPVSVFCHLQLCGSAHIITRASGETSPLYFFNASHGNLYERVCLDCFWWSFCHECLFSFEEYTSSTNNAVVLVHKQIPRLSELATSGNKTNIATEEEKLAGQTQIQDSHWTKFNRYPDEYGAVEKYLNKDRQKKLRLLSFGAATGQEAISLASMYFTDSVYNDVKIFGVDLHQPSLDEGTRAVAAHDPKINEGKITFFNWEDTLIDVHGPYDAIFANSVLCYHGTKVTGLQSIIDKYPFQNFEDSLVYLDKALKVGGVLAIVNSSYFFLESEVSKKYRAIAKCYNFVPKVDRNNVTFMNVDLSSIDCLWVKESA